MKRFFMILLLAGSFTAVHASHDWIFLNGNNEESVYYWSDIRQDRNNPNIKIVRLVINSGHKQESNASDVVFDCTNKTFHFENYTRYDQYFARGNITRTRTRRGTTHSVGDRMPGYASSQELYTQACNNH